MGLHVHLPIDHFKKSLLLEIVHKRHLAFFTNNNECKNCKKTAKMLFFVSLNRWVEPQTHISKEPALRPHIYVMYCIYIV